MQQGDPIAAYLFILSLKILPRRLRNSSIQPWKSKKGIEHLVEGYADDLTVILRLLSMSENKAQVKELTSILQDFKEISGLAINLSKKNLVPFGRFLEPKILQLVDHAKIKRADNFKLLGISFNN